MNASWHPSAPSEWATLLAVPVLVLGLTAFSLATAAAPPADAPPVFDARTQTWKFEREIPAVVGGASGPEQARLDCDWLFAINRRVHDEPAGQHLWPDIAVGPDGTIAVAWMDDHAAGGYHIYYSFSTDNGATWAPPEPIDTRGAGAYSKFVDIEFTPSGMPVAVWEDDRFTAYNVFFSKRDPSGGGTPWTPNVRVNTAGSPPSSGDFMNASIAVLDEDRYFVAWTDWREGAFHQVYACGTTDGGETWGAETRVSDGLGYQPVAADPCLIVDPTSGPNPGEEVLACVTNDWRGNVPGGRYPNVYFYRSTDGGSSWSTGVQVNDVETYYQQASSHALVRLDDGTLVAGWLNNPDLMAHHFHTCASTDQGATWEPSAQVDPPSDGGCGTYSSITAFEGWVYAGFDLAETTWNAYFRASSDGGRNWSEDACRMDDDTSGGAAQNTVLAARAIDVVHGAWSDSRPGLTNWKIYTARGERGAAGIGEPDEIAGPPVARLLCAPNPSRVGTAVEIRLGGDDGARRLAVVDALGRVVRELELGPDGTASWDGAGASGRALAPGVYWLQARGSSAWGGTRARIVRLP